jgi:CubicO group peptidase (beta-lactamase class C family)
MDRRAFLLAAGALAAAAPACSDANVAGAPAVLSRTTGLDPALLQASAEQGRALPRLRSMIVARDGEIQFEETYRGPGLDTPVNIKSASKSVLSAIAGAAIARGVLTGVDQTVAPFLRDRLPADPDPRLLRLTVGDLLSMRAGLRSTSGPNYGAWGSSPDWVRFALAQPFVAEPGGPMIYSTGTSHVLSAVLTRAAGRSTLELARDWIGAPLEVQVPAWPQDPQGVYVGGNDMRLSPRALLRFGEMYRSGGRHEGAQVLPAAWITDSWSPRGRSAWSGAPYGYGWWLKTARGHPVRFAWGYGGQMVFIVPDLRLTVVMISDPAPAARDGHVDALHALLDDGLVPAAERGARTVAA